MVLHVKGIEAELSGLVLVHNIVVGNAGAVYVTVIPADVVSLAVIAELLLLLILILLLGVVVAEVVLWLEVVLVCSDSLLVESLLASIALVLLLELVLGALRGLSTVESVTKRSL